jgi:N-acetylneuraminic acid mutarotase
MLARILNVPVLAVAVVVLFALFVQERLKRTNTDLPLHVWYRINAPNGPSPRLSHSAVGIHDIMYVFGGLTGFADSVHNDLWAFDAPAKTWTEIKPTGAIPPARFLSSLVVVDDDHLLLYGGFNVFTPDQQKPYGDLWMLNIPKRSWSKLEPVGVLPSARGAHTSVFYEGSMYVFGGFEKIGAAGHRNEMWKYNVASNTWTEISAKEPDPFPRGRIGADFTVVGTRAYLFGGGCELQPAKAGSNGQCDDHWVYDFQTEKWSELKSRGAIPLARRASQSDVAIYGVVYQYGGVHIEGKTLTMYDDFHAYDPLSDTWFELHPNWDRGPRPPKTFGHSVVRIHKTLLMFGGRAETPTSPGTNQLWQYTSPIPLEVTSL